MQVERGVHILDSPGVVFDDDDQEARAAAQAVDAAGVEPGRSRASVGL